MKTFAEDDARAQNQTEVHSRAADSGEVESKVVLDPFLLTSPAYWSKALRAIFLQNSLNLLMLCFPVALYAQHSGYSEGIVFFTSLFAIAPFAERLSFVTEQLALHTSEALGGLLNATFGNVTELIVSFFALRAGLLRIVQVSLLGSILSNLLLVLGCAFFAGGIRHKHQHFNAHGSAINIGLLMLSVMSLLFPMLLDSSHQVLAEGAVLAVSRSVSCLLLIVYACYIYFQMHTHAHLYEVVVDPERGLTKSVERGEEEDDDEDDVEEEAVLGVAGAVIWLTVRIRLRSSLADPRCLAYFPE
jgi:Ca2+:H+ antiporter